MPNRNRGRFGIVPIRVLVWVEIVLLAIIFLDKVA